MIVSKEFVEEIDGLWAHETLIVSIHKALPRFLGESAEDVVVLSVKFDVIFVEVLEELVRTENLGNLDQLIRVTVSVEKRFFPEYHGSEHGAQRPHVQRVIVFLVVD